MSIEIKNERREEFMSLERNWNKIMSPEFREKAQRYANESNIPINLSAEASRKYYLLYNIDKYLNTNQHRKLRALLVLRVNGVPVNKIRQYMKVHASRYVSKREIEQAEKEGMKIVMQGISISKEYGMPLFGDAADQDPQFQKAIKETDCPIQCEIKL